MVVYRYRQTHACDPSPLERGDDEVPEYPAQCTGILSIRDDTRTAIVQFFLSGDGLHRPEALGDRYRGEGVYVLSNDRVWVVVEHLQYSMVRNALARIADALDDAAFSEGQYIKLS